MDNYSSNPAVAVPFYSAACAIIYFHPLSTPPFLQLHFTHKPLPLTKPPRTLLLLATPVISMSIYYCWLKDRDKVTKKLPLKGKFAIKDYYFMKLRNVQCKIQVNSAVDYINDQV